jgi:hypothetical protein
MVEGRERQLAVRCILPGGWPRLDTTCGKQGPVWAWSLADLSVSSHLAQQNHLEDLP